MSIYKIIPLIIIVMLMTACTAFQRNVAGESQPFPWSTWQIQDMELLINGWETAYETSTGFYNFQILNNASPYCYRLIIFNHSDISYVAEEIDGVINYYRVNRLLKTSIIISRRELPQEMSLMFFNNKFLKDLPPDLRQFIYDLR